MQTSYKFSSDLTDPDKEFMESIIINHLYEFNDQIIHVLKNFRQTINKVYYTNSFLEQDIGINESFITISKAYLQINCNKSTVYSAIISNLKNSSIRYISLPKQDVYQFYVEEDSRKYYDYFAYKKYDFILLKENIQNIIIVPIDLKKKKYKSISRIPLPNDSKKFIIKTSNNKLIGVFEKLTDIVEKEKDIRVLGIIDMNMISIIHKNFDCIKYYINAI